MKPKKVGRVVRKVKGVRAFNSIVETGRSCSLCGNTIIQSTIKTKKSREKQMYCSNTCKRNALRIKNPAFASTPLNKSQREKASSTLME